MKEIKLPPTPIRLTSSLSPPFLNNYRFSLHRQFRTKENTHIKLEYLNHNITYGFYRVFMKKHLPRYRKDILVSRIFLSSLCGSVRKYRDAPRGSKGGLIKARNGSVPLVGTAQGARRRGDRPAALKGHRIYE